ncbi:transcription factor che-1-like [Drosophila biarmipes]|uniref:transcription factor che-1-like n=1 Tax=Drosophila biarmipes TaxID=125945 RepID=UPI0007E87C60|nr:transcription factor che-1-like [Drosophila biarmipes]
MDLSQLCRICLKKRDCLIDLFVEDKEEPTLAAMLWECSGCSVVKLDGKPQFICLKCADATRIAFHLIRLTQESDQHLDMLRVRDNAKQKDELGDQAGQATSTKLKEELELNEDGQSAEGGVITKEELDLNGGGQSPMWEYQPGGFANTSPRITNMLEEAAEQDLGQVDQNSYSPPYTLRFPYSPFSDHCEQEEDGETKGELDLNEGGQSAKWHYQAGDFAHTSPSIATTQEEAAGQDADQAENPLEGFFYSAGSPDPPDWSDSTLLEDPYNVGSPHSPTNDHSKHNGDQLEDVVAFAYSPLSNHSQQGEEELLPEAAKKPEPEDQPKASTASKSKRIPPRRPSPPPGDRHYKNLKTHVRKHKTKSRFQCLKCRKFYANNSSLKAHFRTHTGERPFACCHCNSRFRQSSAFLRHVRNAHPKKDPYLCKICQFTSARMSALKKHMKAVHGLAYP